MDVTSVDSAELAAVTLAAPVPASGLCVQTRSFWVRNVSSWPSPYDASADFWGAPDVNGVHHSWLETLTTPPRHHSAWFTAAREYITAVLNGGWDYGSTEVLEAIDNAEDWFKAGPGWGIDVEGGSVSESLFGYAEVLKEFNKGKDTLPRCTGHD
jgi:hypothetical protein